MDQLTLSVLSGFPDQLERLFNAFPKKYANWAPASWEGIPSEQFTALEQICHVRDIETDGYHVRIRRLLQEVNPTLASVESYDLAKERAYADAAPSDVLAAFRTARAVTVDMIRGLTADELSRQGVFEGYGRVTLRGVIHFLCSHDQQHLAGMQWLLGKIASESAAGGN
jgi:DinB superfamily